MNIRLSSHRSTSKLSAFTMLEIALCLAIIGFALVAIIGILPAGIQVQKDNRADTLVSQDAAYWMEALRNGDQVQDELTNFVEIITTNGVQRNFANAREIIGILCTPGPGMTNVAIVRAISGSMSERSSDANIKDFAFKYQLRVEVLPFETAANYDSPDYPALASRLREVRITFRWPIFAKGQVGNSRQSLRALISGDLFVETNNNFYFFRQ